MHQRQTDPLVRVRHESPMDALLRRPLSRPEDREEAAREADRRRVLEENAKEMARIAAEIEELTGPRGLRVPESVDDCRTRCRLCKLESCPWHEREAVP